MYQLLLIIPAILVSLLKQPETVTPPTASVTETATAEAEPPSTKEYAHIRVAQEFGEEHWKAYDNLIEKESGWNPTVCNSRSTACGLGQFLAQTRANYGITVESQPNDQVEAVIKYIKDRYSNPTEAWRFHIKNNWY
jgi:hypothetical protein